MSSNIASSTAVAESVPVSLSSFTVGRRIGSSAEECVDIKAFLWQKSADLTSLPSTMCVFAVIYSMIVTLGVVGNCLVIASVYRHRSLQSVRNIFIVSLSCSDVVVSIVSGTITPITAFTKVWLFGAALCKLVPVIQGISLCFSTLTLTAISIDRFILIIYPTRRSIQKRHAFRMILLNWLIATAISTPMFFKQVLIDFNNFCGRFCAEDWGSDQSGRSTYGTLVFVLQFVFPFFVITFCYVMISLKLSKGMMLKRDANRSMVGSQKRKSDESGSSVPVLPDHKMSFVIEYSSSPCQRPKKSASQKNGTRAGSVNGGACLDQRQMALRRRLRTNRMLMAMVGVFLCCWTPSVVFNFLRDYQWMPSIVSGQEYLCGIITHCISMSSTVWNPILYALLNEHFRLAFMELLRRGKNRRKREALLNDESTAENAIGSRLLRYSRLISNTCLTSVASGHRALLAAFISDTVVDSAADKDRVKYNDSDAFLPSTVTSKPVITKNVVGLKRTAESTSSTAPSESMSRVSGSSLVPPSAITKVTAPSMLNEYATKENSSAANPICADEIGFCESDEEI